MTITEQLEGLLPADGPVTKTDRIIAEAAGELRSYDRSLAEAINMEWELRSALDWSERKLDLMGDRKPWKLITLAFASGIALAVVVGVVV